MGLIDKVAELLPWRSERHDPPPPPPRGGVLSLRDDLDHWLGRLLDEARGFPFGEAGWTPSADVHETDDALVVTVEVPGLDPADLDLMITPSGLIIRGEKREVREERPADVRVTPEGCHALRLARAGGGPSPWCPRGRVPLRGVRAHGAPAGRARSGSRRGARRQRRADGAHSEDDDRSRYPPHPDSSLSRRTSWPK